MAATQGGLGIELASEIPLAILSADATAGESQRTLSAGALAYMSKPLDVVELLRLVDSAVARR